MALGRMCRIACACGIALSAIAAARAEEYKKGENPLSVISRWRPTAEPAPMPDFVQRSRPQEENLDYTPLAAPKVDRPKVKTKDELAATMQGLDAAAKRTKAKGAGLVGSSRADAQRGLQAAAENRRRAAEAFRDDGKGAGKSAE